MAQPSFQGQVGDADIKLLRVFKTVVECGGFTAAEAELGLARSTISTHIANLETRLGLRLCERGRGGFALTEEGRLVFQEVVRLMTALDSFRAQVSTAQRRLVGEFNLAIIDGILTLPEIPISETLSRFRAKAPDVHITISVLSTDEMERRLLDGTVHLAFCAMHRPKSGLAYSHVAKEVQSVYCGRLHPLYSKPDELIGLEDLTRPDYVGRTFQDTLRTREKPFRTGPAASANNLEAILILLQTGRYLGLMPDQCAAPWVAAGQIRALRPDLTRVEQDFALVTRDTKRPAPVIEAFQQTYREEVSKQNAAQMA